jgi:cation transport ATPase
VGFEDPPRPDVPAAIRRCRDAGIKVMMVTGDHPHTAAAIAREIGLVTEDQPSVLTGDDLRRMSDAQLQLALDAPVIVCARVTADQKLRIVQALQRKRHVVAVTGDGVNDGPALRAADVGIAMGLSGTDVAPLDKAWRIPPRMRNRPRLPIHSACLHLLDPRCPKGRGNASVLTEPIAEGRQERSADPSI